MALHVGQRAQLLAHVGCLLAKVGHAIASSVVHDYSMSCRTARPIALGAQRASDVPLGGQELASAPKRGGTARAPLLAGPVDVHAHLDLGRIGVQRSPGDAEVPY